MHTATIKQQLIELEQLLVQPATRLSAEMLNRHLADDFYEIAATGRCFGKADVLQRLPSETPPVITQQDFTCKVLSDGLAQLTYRAIIQRTQNDRPSYSVRSSIYRFNGEKWQMIFHQGTVCEPFDVVEYDAMQEKIELLEELRMAEAQLSSGAGVSNNDARAQVLARISELK
ncbi:nuclear transport factor 2 family protein [Rheinheimera fenheensis]|uniref:nuclear transport factor 2 family protein n=1 Tax=Rheinheimera fenheensis TaxID=3152295 RepID=UPI003261D0D4